MDFVDIAQLVKLLQEEIVATLCMGLNMYIHTHAVDIVSACYLIDWVYRGQLSLVYSSPLICITKQAPNRKEPLIDTNRRCERTRI